MESAKSPPVHELIPTHVLVNGFPNSPFGQAATHRLELGSAKRRALVLMLQFKTHVLENGYPNRLLASGQVDWQRLFIESW